MNLSNKQPNQNDLLNDLWDSVAPRVNHKTGRSLNDEYCRKVELRKAREERIDEDDNSGEPTRPEPELEPIADFGKGDEWFPRF